MKKIWAVVVKIAKAVWKPLLVILGILGLVAIGREAVTLIQGPVATPKNWTPDPSDPSKIIIAHPDGSLQSVKLPSDAKGKQVVASQVAAVGANERGGWSVSVKSEGTPNFRG